MGQCLAISSLQADSKVNLNQHKFTAWPTSWRPPGADQLAWSAPKLTLAYDVAP